jgi:hypothetical protein
VVEPSASLTPKGGSGRGKGPARSYRWETATRGNRIAEVHGARSERRVAPLAAQIEQAARSGPGWPDYLDDPGYASAVAAWARAEAIVELLWQWLAEQGPLDALSSTSDSTTETEQHESGSRSRTTARRTESALNQLARWEATAARQRQRLGLDPLSRARLGRDVTAARVDLVELLTRAREDADAAAAAEGDHPGGDR